MSAAERGAWRALMGMAFQLAGELGRALAETTAISYQDYLVLAVLRERGGNARPTDIGRELGWEKSRVSHHVARMDSRGLVTRKAVPTDGRGALVVATAKGLRAAEAAGPVHDDIVRRHFLDVVSDRDLATVRRIAERSLASLANPLAAE